jgi:hypothetical protein
LRASGRVGTTLLMLVLACVAHGQTRVQQQSSETKRPVARDSKARAAELRARKQIQAAVAVLLEVEREAASLEDSGDRAYVVASCADALWDTDEPRARAMFRRAWEAAIESAEADLKEAKEGGYADNPGWFTQAREQVIKFAARRDARMADEWARTLDEWFVRREADDGAGKGSSRLGDEPYSNFTREGRRLALASSLADDGEHAAAARTAAPALRAGVSGLLVEFLLNLRARAPEEADRLYLNLLAATRANPSASANDVLMLSSYALTPRLLAVVGDDGSLRLRTLGEAGGAHAQEASTTVRAAFYETAASILLRPAPGATAALYFALGRLLPFFEREAPAYAQALRAQMSTVATGLDVSRLASLDSTMAMHSPAARNPHDPLAPLLEDLGRMDAAGVGDAARARAVSVAAQKGLWERAKRLAGEIKDDEKRTAALSLIGLRQVAWLQRAYADAEADDIEKAAAFVRQVELPAKLTHALRAYGLARAAELSTQKGRGDLTYALLDEAIAHAQQVEAGTELRAASTLMTATFASRLAPTRTWETLVSAVSAINADKEFSGDGVEEFEPVKYGLDEAQALTEIFAPFTVEKLFEAAGTNDLARATAEARNLEDRLARSHALVAAARPVLRKRARSAGGQR